MARPSGTRSAWTGPQNIALADTAPADAPIIGLVALAAGEQRGTAVGTEVLEAHPAVVTALAVDLGRAAGELDVGLGADRGHPERRSRQGLAVTAVTDRDRLRVDLGFKGDLAAMALPVDLHDQSPEQKRRPKAPLYHLSGLRSQ